MQVVGQHPFLSPGKMHHAVTVELVPGQPRQKGPHHHMDDEKKYKQPIRLLIFDTVTQHCPETIFYAPFEQRVPDSLWSLPRVATPSFVLFRHYDLRSSSEWEYPQLGPLPHGG